MRYSVVATLVLLSLIAPFQVVAQQQLAVVAAARPLPCYTDGGPLRSRVTAGRPTSAWIVRTRSPSCNIQIF